MRARRKRLVWWLFDRTPTRFQDWAESWARTLVVHRQRQRPIQFWSGSTASTMPGKITYRTP